MPDRMNFYRVGNKKFFNKFLAFAESKRSRIPLTFDLFEETFDRADWTHEPATPWEELLDIRARQIAALNRPIVLGFSGGTDSLTIYNVFKRNNIKISTLFVRIKKNSKKEAILYKDVIPFVEREKQIHKFDVIYTDDTVDLYNAIYSTPDWALSDLPVRVQFSVAIGFASIEELPSYAPSLDTNFIFVLGSEKPRIKIINGQFYSYQQDNAFIGYDDPRHDYFYISPDLPELHIKQSYMLARFIIDESNRTGRPLEYYNSIHNTVEFDYLRYSLIGCGRHGDLANSDKQKILNRTSRLIVPDNDINRYIYCGRSDDVLQAGVLDNKSYATNYFKGIMNLKTDSVFKELFTSKENYYSVRDIDSKYYKLQLT
jgi:hypothetical protein